MKKRDCRLIGLQLRNAARARGQVSFEFAVDAGRQVMLDEIGKEGDDIVAAAFLSHDDYSSGSGLGSSKYPNPKPGNLKLKPLSGRGKVG